SLVRRRAATGRGGIHLRACIRARGGERARRTQMAEQTTTKPGPSRARRIYEEVRGLAVTAAVMLFAGTAIGQPFIVPSGSMEPTLMIGDEIAAAKYAYGYGRYSLPIGVLPVRGRFLDRSPERGDIVVFA